VNWGESKGDVICMVTSRHACDVCALLHILQIYSAVNNGVYRSGKDRCGAVALVLAPAHPGCIDMDTCLCAGFATTQAAYDEVQVCDTVESKTLCFVASYPVCLFHTQPIVSYEVVYMLL
jgi:hypothetical protein